MFCRQMLRARYLTLFVLAFLVSRVGLTQDLGTVVEVLPPKLTLNDQISIRLYGVWHNGCIPGDPKLSQLNGTIRIETSNPSAGCTQALTPWASTVFVGSLPAGSYEVIVTYTHISSGSTREIARSKFSVEPAQVRRPSQAPGRNPARQQAVFPFFVQHRTTGRSGYNSAFEVINPNPGKAILQFNFYDSRGESVRPLAASGQGSIITPTSLEVEGFGVGQILFSFAGDAFFSGWVWIEANAPVIVGEAISHVVLVNPCPLCLAPPFFEPRLRSRMFKSPESPAYRLLVRVRFDSGSVSTNTSFAIVFPWNPPAPDSLARLQAVGKAILRTDSNQVVDETVLTVAINGQYVAFVTDLFPKIQTGFSGSLELIFDQQVAVTAVQVTTSREFAYGVVVTAIEERWEEPTMGTIQP